MILLDTNVLSAMMQLVPDATVAAWLDHQPRASIWITTITIMEVRSGLQAMPVVRKRGTLANAFSILLNDKIQGRIAPFDILAAEHAAELIARRRLKGRPVDDRDTMIAGIALATRAMLATRNTAHFEDASVPLINPWEA